LWEKWGNNLKQKQKINFYASLHDIAWMAKPNTMQGVGDMLQLNYNLQIWKLKLRECKPKRLSWAAYNALEYERGRGFWHHNSWMLP
jgi:hypothetical protein